MPENSRRREFLTTLGVGIAGLTQGATYVTGKKSPDESFSIGIDVSTGWAVVGDDNVTFSGNIRATRELESPVEGKFMIVEPNNNLHSTSSIRVNPDPEADYEIEVEPYTDYLFSYYAMANLPESDRPTLMSYGTNKFLTAPSDTQAYDQNTVLQAIGRKLEAVDYPVYQAEVGEDGPMLAFETTLAPDKLGSPPPFGFGSPPPDTNWSPERLTAACYAEGVALSQNLTDLSVWVYGTDETLIGSFEIDRDWAEAENTGSISSGEYVDRIAETWEYANRDHEEDENWFWSYDVQSDDTLELIEDGLDGETTLQGYYDSYSTHLYGVVENISGYDLDNATVHVNFYVNDVIVAEGFDIVNNLPAGNRWRFNAISADSVRFDHAGVYLNGSTY